MVRLRQQKLARSAHRVVRQTCNAPVRVTYVATAGRVAVAPDLVAAADLAVLAGHPFDAVDEVAAQVFWLARDLQVGKAATNFVEHD